MELGEREAVQIGDLALLDIMAKKELALNLGDELFQRNVRETKRSGDFIGFTGQEGGNSSKFVIPWYVGCVKLIQDRAKVVDKRFVLLYSGAVFSPEEVREDRDALGQIRYGWVRRGQSGIGGNGVGNGVGMNGLCVISWVRGRR